MEVILIILMVLESIMDIRTKQVWIIPPIALMLVGTAWNLWQREINVAEVMAIVLTVLVLAVISKASGQALGMGDVWLIGSVLAVEGVLMGMESLMIAFILSGLYGGIQFLIHNSGKRTFPMAPFLLVGVIGGMWTI